MNCINELCDGQMTLEEGFEDVGSTPDTHSQVNFTYWRCSICKTEAEIENYGEEEDFEE